MTEINRMGIMEYLVGAIGFRPETHYRYIRRFHLRTISRRDFWFYWWIPFREDRIVRGLPNSLNP